MASVNRFLHDRFTTGQLGLVLLDLTWGGMATAGPLCCTICVEPTLNRLQTLCDDGTKAVSTWSLTLQQWQTTITPPPGRPCARKLSPQTRQWEGRCRWEEGRLMLMPEYRCVEYTCGWQGREPAWEDGDTIPRPPLCPRCDGEVEELSSTNKAQTMMAAYETSRDPIEEQREALLDYLDAAVTWRADHRLHVGLEDVSLRAVLKGLAGDAALVPPWLCDDLGLIYGMTYGELVEWIKDRLA